MCGVARKREILAGGRLLPDGWVWVALGVTVPSFTVLISIRLQLTSIEGWVFPTILYLYGPTMFGCFLWAVIATVRRLYRAGWQYSFAVAFHCSIRGRRLPWRRAGSGSASGRSITGSGTSVADSGSGRRIRRAVPLAVERGRARGGYGMGQRCCLRRPIRAAVRNSTRPSFWNRGARAGRLRRHCVRVLHSLVLVQDVSRRRDLVSWGNRRSCWLGTSPENRRDIRSSTPPSATN